jgi:hypothetical protein
VLHERQQLGVRVVVVGFAEPESLRTYQQRQGLQELLVLADPDRRAYRAFGLGRGRFARIWLDPRVWARYLRLILAGARPEPAREDPLQLGGDALLDAEGRITWIYRSRGPEDRPSLEQIAAARSGPEPPRG